MQRRLSFCAMVIVTCSAAIGQTTFINWENPPVHPLEMTPDGLTLLAVNSADARLEIFSLASGLPVANGSVPVGLDPVSVRARSNTEAWVVNKISDSVSVVDLVNGVVVATLTVGDEPADVIFAGSPPRAFVSVAALNQVKVYDPNNLSTAPTVVSIQGEDPRALATDGARVYAAIFESGNRTTILPEAVVSSTANPYAGDPNPPPNSGASFVPPIAGGLPTPPKVGLIVQRDVAGGVWRDDNTGIWTPSVTWNLHDNDVAVIDANSLAVTYAKSLMNANMSLAVGPGGDVFVVGTEAINVKRFEPNLNGIFARVKMARFNPGTLAVSTNVDLNPHLTYASSTVAQGLRDQSIGDPRGVAWNAAGTIGYVSGMGSNNVIVVDPAGARLNRVDVGQGPTGLVLDEARSHLYVLNRFDATVSTVDTSAVSVVNTVGFHDTTPAAVKNGRPFLYDTHATSGLGQTSCAGCHIDARMDFLAWDLGDPSGAMKTFNQTCFTTGCDDWHPMKGPMTTQSLIGISGSDPLHWRGDRENLAAFNVNFLKINGDDATLTPAQMTDFTNFVATIKHPPNPNRNFDSSLPTTFPNGGDPNNGASLFVTNRFDGNLFKCVDCHAGAITTNNQIISDTLEGQTQGINVPNIRAVYLRTGANFTSANGNMGFGLIHDGSTDTVFNFLQNTRFKFATGATGDQQRRDCEAYVMCISTDTPPAVGVQVTINTPVPPAPQQTLINNMVTLANGGTVSLIAKGRAGGIPRGYKYNGGGLWQPDRAAEATLTTAQLQALAGVGNELTITVVGLGMQTRLGVDRDLDSYFDRDELDVCSDPANAASTPLTGSVLVGDLDNNGVVNLSDLSTVLSAYGKCSGDPGYLLIADLDHSGCIDLSDLSTILAHYGQVCPLH